MAVVGVVDHVPRRARLLAGQQVHDVRGWARVVTPGQKRWCGTLVTRASTNGSMFAIFWAMPAHCPEYSIDIRILYDEFLLQSIFYIP